MSEIGIDINHQWIHDGYAFCTNALFTSVANGATVNFAFKTPLTAKVHIKDQEFWASGNKVRTDFYEAPTTAPAAGSDMPTFNKNRNSATLTKMQAVKANSTINTAGSSNIETLMFGNNQPYRSINNETMLKPDTWYIRTFTNSTGAAIDISYYQFWYEVD